MFTPIRQSRASGEIVSQIERAIFAAELSPGDRLQSERELAEQFGVSRITVRDALRVLEARGLIRVKVGAMGGAFVADANTDRVAESISTLIKLKRMTLSELAEARKVVEAATAELAAQRADAAAVSRLQQNVVRARPLLREPITHADASMDFHVELARAAGNEVLYARSRRTGSCSCPASTICVTRSPAERRRRRTRSWSRRFGAMTRRAPAS